MDNPKYRTEPEGDMLRIYAVRAFLDVKIGDKGGLIRSDDNLSHDGDAWVSGDARVSGDAWVSGNARVFDDAWVFGGARVFDQLTTASRSDGYTFALLPMEKCEPKISAGCRLFTFPEARAHWVATRGGTALGDETMAIIDHLERVGKIRGIVPNIG